jgi:hypothetical protein
MKRIGWIVVAVAVTWGCGGGGGGGGKDPGGGGFVATHLADVRGYNVPAGAETVGFEQWPSWLHEGQLVTACAAGKISYGDVCWDSMVIDTDAGSVTFTAGTSTSVLAMGSALPSILGTALVDSAHGCRAAIDTWSCVWPHHANTGYVMMAGPVLPTMGFASEDIWDSPIVGMDLGRPSIRSPWVIGNEIELDSGLVGGFAVKTTQMYGLKQTKETPTTNDFVIVHNWPYTGSMKVNGVTVALPATLASIAAAAAVLPKVASDGSAYVDVQGAKVRFMSDQSVLDARTRFAGGGSGLTDTDLVTSVEFNTAALLAP